MKYAFVLAALSTSSAITVEKTDYFLPGFSGALGASTYSRVTPERFASDDDDIFMRSMIQ